MTTPKMKTTLIMRMNPKIKTTPKMEMTIKTRMTPKIKETLKKTMTPPKKKPRQPLKRKCGDKGGRLTLPRETLVCRFKFFMTSLASLWFVAQLALV